MTEESPNAIDRRTLIQAAGGLALGLSSFAAAANKRHRYAIVGVGSRSRMYQKAITETYRDSNELVAICDSNPGRLRLAADIAAKVGAAPKPYAAADFDRMLADTRPDTVVVTSPDATHNEYIVRILDGGCHAITEKPMTTTAEKAQTIFDACKRNNRHVRVMFNYRYSPPRTQVKDLLMSNAIGDVQSVDFNWLLNTLHGADYFRRWHSHKAISGGLMVHKATHHFDLVNWWLGTQPETVLAYGKRDFYTPQMAQRLGLKSHHERCHTCPETNACSFYLDLAADPGFKTLYLDNEQYDGYFRDQCVFRPGIDIEDTMNVIVRYQGGATLSYSLNAFNAWEGYRVAFNGTKGRIEHEIQEPPATSAGASEPGGTGGEDIVRTRLIPMRGKIQEIEPWTAAGSHGGGDDVMLKEVFGTAPPDKYKRVADERSGAYSMLIGAAANLCFKSGQAVRIADLVNGLTAPDMAPMPTHDMQIPMPRKV
jgi:predicted dehydrogenase